MRRVALITGISGQDGHYLAHRLDASGYELVGTSRSVPAANAALGDDLASRATVIEWNLEEQNLFEAILRDHRPTHVFNLAALSSGEFMDRNPTIVSDINGMAVLRMLEGIRAIDSSIRFCQASSSEVFAGSGVSPQDERTPRVPRSVYGAAKIFADNIIRLYRQKYGLFASSAFLFNHESPRRGEGFVTTKVVKAAVAIKRGLQKELFLGNLAAARDWGFAGDFMCAMQLMAEAGAPDDFVIATGKAHNVAELCALAFSALSLDYRDHVAVDAQFYRPIEPAPIIGDASHARKLLGWQPTTPFKDIVSMMVTAELEKQDAGAVMKSYSHHG